MDNTTQIYLEVILDSGSVRGESTVGGYEQQIDIDGFSFAASAKKSALKDINQGVKSNLDLSRVTISKVFDGASILLANALKERAHFERATISVDQQFVLGGDSKYSEKIANQILIIDLYDGYIADIKLQTSESGAGAEIKEDLELTFHNISITYYAEERSSTSRLLTTDWRPKAWRFMTSRQVQGA